MRLTRTAEMAMLSVGSWLRRSASAIAIVDSLGPAGRDACCERKERL
jgi:hypothetical protein